MEKPTINQYFYKFYKPEIWTISKLHLHLSKPVTVFTLFILLPMLMKVLHSFKGMVNNVSYIYIDVYYILYILYVVYNIYNI